MQFSDSNLVSGSFDYSAKIWGILKNSGLFCEIVAQFRHCTKVGLSFFEYKKDIAKAYCVSTLLGHTAPIHSMQVRIRLASLRIRIHFFFFFLGLFWLGGF